MKATQFLYGPIMPRNVELFKVDVNVYIADRCSNFNENKDDNRKVLYRRIVLIQLLNYLLTTVWFYNSLFRTSIYAVGIRIIP